MTREQWLAFCSTLPQAGAHDNYGLYYLLPIGKQGLLLLTGCTASLDEEVATLLLSLTVRLDAAIGLCLQHEVLAAAHRTAVLESNMLRTVLEATPTVLLAVDNEGRYIFSEGRMLEALSSKPGAIVGQSVFEVFRNAPEVLDGVRAALAGESRSLTVQINNRNWDVTYEPLVEESGLVTCVVGVAHDVTERTAAIDSLSAVLQTVGEGILSLDAKGHIALVNAELEHTFGYAAQELLGQPVGLLLPELTSAPTGAQTSPPAPLPWRDFLGQRRELEGRRKDGAAFPVEVCINEIASGDQVRYTVSLRDITEHKEYERLRDEFVSTVSHELRTPLASIMGWTETLLTEHPGPLNDNQRRFLNIVYNSSQRLNRLIEEILTVSRIQRGTLRVHSELMQPAQLLAAVRENAAPAAERQGIHLHFEDVWPAEETVMGDPQLLEQVINNLIANAAKFSRQGGEVYVRSLPAHGGWRLEVQDYGMGVRAADLPKLFQRFVRGSNAKEVHVQGAGLGLFVCKAIVEAHGGEIYLTSREGEGTTVWFDLPLRRPSGVKDVQYGA
jgi:PAS domain S-box-containing protein